MTGNSSRATLTIHDFNCANYYSFFYEQYPKPPEDSLMLKHLLSMLLQKLTHKFEILIQIEPNYFLEFSTDLSLFFN